MIKIETLKNYIAILFLVTGTSQAYSASSAMEVSGPATPPIGAVQFCGEHPADCGNYDRINQVVRLTTSAWSKLNAVNSAVNTSVLPATDMQIYGTVERWEYPRLAGDCEDYALEKRRELIRSGWPASALLMTVVRDEVGDGHAVLTVRTDKGDLILDNKTDSIELWTATPYAFLKRQSTRNATDWDGIEDGRSSVVGSLQVN